MIIANLATYPKRFSNVPDVLRRISPQVDRVNVVFNEVDHVPGLIGDFSNVSAILPDHDTKDTGKFAPDVSDAEWVFLIDDDMNYPSDYISHTLREIHRSGVELDSIFGYHASIFAMPKPPTNLKRAYKYLRYRFLGDENAGRRVILFDKHVETAMRVDQVATCAAVLKGTTMPPYGFMRQSAKFVDVRLALWAYCCRVAQYTLPREANWLTDVHFSETIYGTFTSHFNRPVNQEIAVLQNWRHT